MSHYDYDDNKLWRQRYMRLNNDERAFLKAWARAHGLAWLRTEAPLNNRYGYELKQEKKKGITTEILLAQPQVYVKPKDLTDKVVWWEDWEWTERPWPDEYEPIEYCDYCGGSCCFLGSCPVRDRIEPLTDLVESYCPLVEVGAPITEWEKFLMSNYKISYEMIDASRIPSEIYKRLPKEKLGLSDSLDISFN